MSNHGKVNGENSMSDMTNFATTGAASAGTGNNKKRTRRNIDERMQEAQKKADMYAARLQRERAKIARLSAQSTKRTRHLEMEELMPLGRALFEALARLKHDINPRKRDGTKTVYTQYDLLMRASPEDRVLGLYDMLRRQAVESSGGNESEVFGCPRPSTKELVAWHKQCEADRTRRAAEIAAKTATTA